MNRCHDPGDSELIALALGLTVGKFASSCIEKKIAESTPEDKDEEGSDDKWRWAAIRGRSYTLLLMLLKVIVELPEHEKKMLTAEEQQK